MTQIINIIEMDFTHKFITRKTEDITVKIPLKLNWDVTNPYYQIHHDACVIKYMCEDLYDEYWLHNKNIDIEKIHIDFKKRQIGKYYNNNRHIFYYDFNDLPNYKVLQYIHYKKTFDNLNHIN